MLNDRCDYFYAIVFLIIKIFDVEKIDFTRIVPDILLKITSATKTIFSVLDASIVNPALSLYSSLQLHHINFSF